MPSSNAVSIPGLNSFLRSLPSEPIEASIELFISLLKRRQIKGSKACAVATASLLRRTVSTTRGAEAGKLIYRIQEVGKRLQDAAPRELAIGNIVRRILGLVRDEEEENRTDLSLSISEGGSEPPTPFQEITTPGFISSTSIAPRRDQDVSTRPPLLSSHTGAPGTIRPITSMFSIMSHPTMRSGISSPGVRSGTSTPGQQQHPSDLRAEVLEGITEIIDELDQADEQIANYSTEHIMPQETILTYSASVVIQRFLLKAATKRKFTVIYAESYPNAHAETHSLLTGNPAVTSTESVSESTEKFQKTLTSAGITVVLIPDSAIFAVMSRVTKVILTAHAVLSNGSFIAPAGSKPVIKAARYCRVPVIVLAATYKLSPLYAYDPQAFIEYGDTAKIVPYQDSELMQGLTNVRNPVWDFIREDEGADLFVTNVGSVSTGYMYKVVRDQYHDEDMEL